MRRIRTIANLHVPCQSDVDLHQADPVVPTATARSQRLGQRASVHASEVPRCVAVATGGGAIADGLGRRGPVFAAAAPGGILFARSRAELSRIAALALPGRSAPVDREPARTSFPPRGSLAYDALLRQRGDPIRIPVQTAPGGGSAVVETFSPGVGRPFITGSESRQVQRARADVAVRFGCPGAARPGRSGSGPATRGAFGRGAAAPAGRGPGSGG